MREIAKLMQRDLDAEIKNLQRVNKIAELSQASSPTLAFIGNFIICKSCIKNYLQKLGYSRGVKPAALCKLYRSTNNFAEIMLAIYYIKILSKKQFRSMGPTAQDIVDKLVSGKFYHYYPVEIYIKLRADLYVKRQESMGLIKNNVKEEKDTIWLRTLTNKKISLNCKQIITNGLYLKVSPAVIVIVAIAYGYKNDINFKRYVEKAEYAITKNFVEHHYIRSFLSDLKIDPIDVKDSLGYTHADLNAMATAMQDDIESLLENINKGTLFDV